MPKRHSDKRAVIRPEVNKIYAKYLFPCTARHVFLFGGAGSGKSVAASQKLSALVNMHSDTKHKILCIRKVYGDIAESMYDRICNELDSHGLGSRFKYNKQPLRIAKKPSSGQTERQQSRFVFRGMDDPEKVKSIEGITLIWIEEATQLSEDEFLQLDLRLRGETNHYYQMILSFNPVSKDHWIAKYAEPQMLNKDDRIEGTGDVKYLVPNKVWEYNRTVEVEGREVITTTRVINTTAEDNRWAKDEYKATLGALAGSDDLMYKVYAQGRWGTLNKEGRFFPTFSRPKHVRPARKMLYNADIPLHLSLDFNVRPYMSGVVMQSEYIEQGYWQGFTEWYELRIIDEICAKAPFNTGQGLAKIFTARYPVNSGFFLYGDATGKRQTGIQGIMGVKSLFDDFKLGLGKYKSFMIERVPSANPRFKAIAKGSLGRHAFMIRLFNGKTVPVRILISDSCKNTIEDFEQCKVAPDGSMMKDADSDGVQKYGHLGDGFMYAMCHPELFGRFARIDF
ncbi:MAG: PBSX family phage terminase large subunit [Aureispira sp.]